MLRITKCQECFVPLPAYTKVCKYCQPSQSETQVEDDFDDISEEVGTLLSPTGVTPKVMYNE